MDKAYLDDITKILREFGEEKFSSQILELTGPDQEGTGYRWRLMSTRYREVTILLVTKKHFMGKPKPEHMEVFGFGKSQQLGPDLGELRTYLASSELELAG